MSPMEDFRPHHFHPIVIYAFIICAYCKSLYKLCIILFKNKKCLVCSNISTPWTKIFESDIESKYDV